jgi:hypothetical protein
VFFCRRLLPPRLATFLGSPSQSSGCGLWGDWAIEILWSNIAMVISHCNLLNYGGRSCFRTWATCPPFSHDLEPYNMTTVSVEHFKPSGGHLYPTTSLLIYYSYYSKAALLHVFRILLGCTATWTTVTLYIHKTSSNTSNPQVMMGKECIVLRVPPLGCFL